MPAAAASHNAARSTTPFVQLMSWYGVGVSVLPAALAGWGALMGKLTFLGYMIGMYVAPAQTLGEQRGDAETEGG